MASRRHRSSGGQHELSRMLCTDAMCLLAMTACSCSRVCSRLCPPLPCCAHRGGATCVLEPLKRTSEALLGGPPLPLVYFLLPHEHGMYWCLIMCRMRSFRVMAMRAQKYSTKTGQNTGILKNGSMVMNHATNIALTNPYQNRNSGTFRVNGLNSSALLVGNIGPWVSGSICNESNTLLRTLRAS